MCSYNFKQLQHHGCHPSEMSGTNCPFQDLRQARHFDKRAERRLLGIHLLGCRMEHQRDSGRSAQREIVLERSRIPREILVWPKLRRIHKDRRDDEIAFAPSDLHQADMPRVQRSHRRHEPNTQATPLGRVDRLPHRREILRQNQPRRDTVRRHSSSPRK